MGMYTNEKTGDVKIGIIIGQVVMGVVFIIIGGAWGCPQYNVWQQTLEGQAELARAQQNRQIKISEAQAMEESAKHLANAEVSRAEGVAKANAIIGQSLKDNEAYLRWLYIEGLKENQHDQIIYVPTEAGLPILEAGRRVVITK